MCFRFCWSAAGHYGDSPITWKWNNARQKIFSTVESVRGAFPPSLTILRCNMTISTLYFCKETLVFPPLRRIKLHNKIRERVGAFSRQNNVVFSYKGYLNKISFTLTRKWGIFSVQQGPDFHNLEVLREKDNVNKNWPKRETVALAFLLSFPRKSRHLYNKIEIVMIAAATALPRFSTLFYHNCGILRFG